jgi:hypothetical protein
LDRDIKFFEFPLSFICNVLLSDVSETIFPRVFLVIFSLELTLLEIFLFPAEFPTDSGSHLIPL